MTTGVSTSETSTPQPAIRIGAPLVIASALASTLGIVISQFLDDLGDGIFAEILGGDAVLYNNRVEFTGAGDLAYAGGFLLTLAVGLFYLFGYPTMRGYGVSRLTALWTLLHVMRQALTQAMLIPLDPDSQLALAYATFDVEPGLDLVIAVAGGLGLLLVALAAGAAFLAFTPHRRLVRTPGRRLKLVLWLALIPAAASVFLAIPFFLPDQESLVIPLLPFTAVMFLFTLAAAPGTTAAYGPDDERHTHWPIGLAFTLIVIAAFYLTVLVGGVSVNPLQWG